jgi:hypothetical protein
MKNLGNQEKNIYSRLNNAQRFQIMKITKATVLFLMMERAEYISLRNFREYGKILRR